MRFERTIKTHAESITKDDLREGAIYFFVSFVDEEMLIPTMETVVFVGKDLDPDDSGRVYFQDVYSFREGIMYSTPSEKNYGEFHAGSEDELGHIFEYDQALDVLIGCSLRRKSSAGVAVE